jgi:Phage integrase family
MTRAKDVLDLIVPTGSLPCTKLATVTVTCMPLSSSWPCDGMISTSKPANCTFDVPRAARPAFTRSEAENYAPCGVYVFVSERLAPLSVAGYQRMVARAGEAAGFPFLVHSHMLRHSCGYKLANDGQDTRAVALGANFLLRVLYM